MRSRPACGELVQRIVDGRQRDRHAGGERLLVQLLGRQMAVALGEQQIGQAPRAGASAAGPRRAPACRSAPYSFRSVASIIVPKLLVSRRTRRRLRENPSRKPAFLPTYILSAETDQ